MTQLFANNASAALASAVTASATTLTLTTGKGASFPNPVAPDFFMLTLATVGADGNENAWEIVKVTARTGDQCTVQRAQEGTTAAAWPAGTRAELRITAALIGNLAQLESPTFTGTPKVPTAANGDNSTQAASTAYVRGTRVDQLAAPTAAVPMNGQKLTGLADPTAAQDAATKAYVDAIKQGLDPKESVRAATTGNITLSGAQTIDGVSVVAGDRVLVKNQTTGSQNGIYVAAAGAWARAADADTSAKVTAGMYCFVEEGTTNADTGWVLTTNGAITLGTTALSFAQFSGAGQIEAGTGLAKTGNTISLNATTTNVPEGTNQYFTAARAVASALTGYAQAGVNAAVTATDTVLTAFGKVQKQITDLIASVNTKAPLESPALTGTPTVPTAANGTNNTQAASTAFVRATRLDQMAAPTAAVPLNNQRITGLGTPTTGTDAATKAYVDTAASSNAGIQPPIARNAYGVISGSGLLHNSPTDSGGVWFVNGAGQTTATKNPAGYATSPDNSYCFINASAPIRRAVQVFQGNVCTLAIGLNNQLSDMIHVNFQTNGYADVLYWKTGVGVAMPPQTAVDCNRCTDTTSAPREYTVELVGNYCWCFQDGVLISVVYDPVFSSLHGNWVFGQLHGAGAENDRLYSLTTFTTVQANPIAQSAASLLPELSRNNGPLAGSALRLGAPDMDVLYPLDLMISTGLLRNPNGQGTLKIWSSQGYGAELQLGNTDDDPTTDTPPVGLRFDAAMYGFLVKVAGMNKGFFSSGYVPDTASFYTESIGVGSAEQDATKPMIMSGTGVPASGLTAPPGSIFMSSNGNVYRRTATNTWVTT